MPSTYMQFCELYGPNGEVQQYDLRCPELDGYAHRFNATGLKPQFRIIVRSDSSGFKSRSSMFILGLIQCAEHETLEAAKAHGVEWAESKLAEFRKLRDSAWRLACAHRMV